jgi:hypothetical protein
MASLARARGTDARHRRHHPGRAGRGDPRRLPGRDRSSAVAPAPARPWWRCTAPPTCSTPTGAASNAAACWWSARAGVHELHRAGAAQPRRGLRDAALHRLRSSPTCCRRCQRPVDDADTASVKGSLKMVEVLKNLVNLPLDDSGDGPRVLVTVKGKVLQLRPPQLAPDPWRNPGASAGQPGAGVGAKALVAALASQVPADTDVEAEEVPEPDHRPGGLRHVHGRLVAHAVRAAGAAPAGRPEGHRAGRRRRPGRRAAGPARRLLRRGRGRPGPSPTPPAGRARRDPRPRADRPGRRAADLHRGRRRRHRVRHHLRHGWARKVEPTSARTTARDLRARARRREPRTSRRCSGGCCAAAARRRRGRSWATSPRAGPDLDEVGRAVRDLIGTAPHRDFRLSVNYRSPAEVFDLAAKVVKPHYPAADLPRAVRSTGHEPELLTTSEAALVSRPGPTSIDRLTDSVGGTVGVIAPPSRREAPARRPAAAPGDPDEPGEPGSRSLFPCPRWRPRAWSTTAFVVVDPDEVPTRSSPRAPAASGCCTSR